MKKDVFSLAALAVGIAGGASAIYGAIKSSDNHQVTIRHDVDNLKAQSKANAAAIDQLRSDVNMIKHQQIETSMDVRYLVKRFDTITEIKVKR